MKQRILIRDEKGRGFLMAYVIKAVPEMSLNLAFVKQIAFDGQKWFVQQGNWPFSPTTSELLSSAAIEAMAQEVLKSTQHLIEETRQFLLLNVRRSK